MSDSPISATSSSAATEIQELERRVESLTPAVERRDWAIVMMAEIDALLAREALGLVASRPETQDQGASEARRSAGES